jgi:hypothetical protein
MTYAPLLLALFSLLAVCQAESPPVAPAKSTELPAAPVVPATPAAPAKAGTSTLTADEERLLRNARAKANKSAEVAPLLKAENESYRLAKEAKDAKKPKAEVDALYAKARVQRVEREAKRDAAILAASPELKPLVEKAAKRGEASVPAAPKSPKDATAPATKEATDSKDA